MEGKDSLRHSVLTVCIRMSVLLCLLSCSERQDLYQAEVFIRICGPDFMTKAYEPPEEKISDLSIMVFDEYGRLEEYRHIENNAIEGCQIRLLAGKKYRFIACANFGQTVYASNTDELKDITFHLAYPDEYREGIAMTADSGYISVKDKTVVTMQFVRLMSKISLRMDRSRLSDGVDMSVRAVRIGNCPKKAKAFTTSRMESTDDRFTTGFSRTYEECSPLNTLSPQKGVSNEITLYLLENMQGKFSEVPISSDREKVFDDDDIRKELCSYIELEIDYISNEKVSSGKCLTYRFYIGEDRNSLDVERNCHYRITVCPEDDGLGEDSWRVDRSGITDIPAKSLLQYPEGYIVGNIGDKIHIGCKVSPKDTPFDIGLEYLEDDKAAGIYDYVIDEDGFGVVLTLTGPGCGLIYMSAGEPVNEAAMWIVEVNLPCP